MPEYDIYLPENIQKQCVLAFMDLTLYFLWMNFSNKIITPSPELINSTEGFEEISIISKEIFKVPQEKLVKTAIDSCIKKING